MESVISVFITVLLPTLYVGGIAAENPGVQVTLTEKGIEKVLEVAVDNFDRYIMDAPPITFSHQSPALNYAFTGLKVVPGGFKKPDARVDVSPSHGLMCMTSGAAFTITGRWSYVWTPSPVHRFADTGTIDIHCRGIAFNVSLKLGKDSSGRTFIHSEGCQPSIKSLSISVNSHKGGNLATVVYNVFLGLANGAIKKNAESLLCDGALDVLNNFDSLLSQQEVLGQVSQNIVLDYSLISTPEFRDGHITTKYKGEFRSTVETDPKFTFSPAPFPTRTFPTRMVNIWISDEVFNSFAFTTFNQRRLNTNITNILVSGTNCDPSAPHSVMCLGKLFPQLEDIYPGSMGFAHLIATNPPVFRTSVSGTSLHMEGNAGVDLCTQNADLSQVFNLKMGLDMAIRFDADGNILKGTADTFGRTKVEPISSEIKIPKAEAFQKLYDEFIKEELQRDLDEIGRIGMRLPEMPGLRFINSMVTHFEGGLMFAADVESAPSRPRTKPTPSPPPQQFVCKPATGPKTSTLTNGSSGHRVGLGLVMLIVIFLAIF